MLRKVSEAVSEGNGPVYQEELGFGQPAPVDEFREIKRLLDQRREKLDQVHDDMKDGMKRLFEQLGARLEQDSRQRRYAMAADETTDTKNRERTEDAATAVQAMRGDSCTTAQKVQDGAKISISFGVIAEPPDLP